MKTSQLCLIYKEEGENSVNFIIKCRLGLPSAPWSLKQRVQGEGTRSGGEGRGTLGENLTRGGVRDTVGLLPSQPGCHSLIPHPKLFIILYPKNTL